MMVLDVLIGRSPLYRVVERSMTLDEAALARAGRVAADFTEAIRSSPHEISSPVYLVR
jgi:hypothetical protein